MSAGTKNKKPSLPFSSRENGCPIGKSEYSQDKKERLFLFGALLALVVFILANIFYKNQ
jgi:hypothetical protein